MNGYALANMKRSWYIPNLYIYGTIGWGEFEYLLVENVNSVNSVLFDTISIGDNSQYLTFSNLIDHKGNNLPATIKNPKVFVKLKSENSAFVVGSESASGFKIVRSNDSTNPVLVDLYVVEMGE